MSLIKLSSSVRCGVIASVILLIRPVAVSTAPVSGPCTFSYRAMPRPSVAELSSVMAPFRLPCMVLAIFEAVPSALRRASSYPETLSMPSVRIMFRPPTDLDVNVVDNAAAFSASPIPEVAASTSVIISVRSRKFPFASMTATATSPIWIFPSDIFAVMSRMIADSFVPASDPLMP